MATILPLLIAVLVGLGSSAQIALIGGMARTRSAPEATFTSLMATVAGVAVVIAFRGFRGDLPQFNAPLDRSIAIVGVAVVSVILLVFAMKGLSPGYAITGLFATAFLLGTAYLGPKLGVAVFFAATTAGSLLGAMVFDAIGAFGAQPSPLNPLRVLAVVVVFAGVALFRIAR